MANKTKYLTLKQQIKSVKSINLFILKQRFRFQTGVELLSCRNAQISTVNVYVTFM